MMAVMIDSGSKRPYLPAEPDLWAALTAEHHRLLQAKRKEKNWNAWGPYLSERQWGTVREDYSPDGAAWNYFTHDMARSRAYRWGEDGIAGISDENQFLCLALVLWNGHDSILKERLFGLANGEGNHGEDVKEVYYYLDATPTHSYLKMLYKYPHAEFPYRQLVQENGRRSPHEREYELIDTGVFDADRYFDVFVEYAKAGPHDILMRVTICNRGPEPASLHVMPQLWFRNTWSWVPGSLRPVLYESEPGHVLASHMQFGQYHFYLEGEHNLLFCENETNPRRIFEMPDAKGYFKDAFHDYVIDGKQDAINPGQSGSKCAAHYFTLLSGGGSATVRVRLSQTANESPFADFTPLFEERQREADLFYAEQQKELEDADARLVQRQALAGMIWSKQFYYYDIPQWLDGDPGQPPPPVERQHGRNWDWRHLNNADIVSMPDKWEYPWYAAWDLAFHCVAFALIDPEFAKSQLVLLTREWYMHPNGQLPAYEWAFGDVNPPVHAWAAWRVFKIDQRACGGRGDLAFLERVFHKLMLNFTWWVNRKDAQGRNIFQGGFLGLDNIGVFDRSAPLPTGGFINQSDGTSWMAMYCLNLMRMALELAKYNHVYEDVATKFFEHFLHIAEAMTNMGNKGIGLWDETDQFYYDVLSLPDGHLIPLKIRSMVGLIPLFAVEVIEPDLLEQVPEFSQRLEWFLNYRPDLAALISNWEVPGRGKRRLLSLLRGHRMKRLLSRMLDENEFLSPYGIRGLSRYHQGHPYVLPIERPFGEKPLSVSYQPGEATSGLFGGNSNWRGPVWFPVNYLLIESLQKFYHYYGEDFIVEYPTRSGHYVSIKDIANALAHRLSRLFLRDNSGRRPVFGDHAKFQDDPHFRDHILFYEYFHGDDGRGLGASHQTGWTGLIAKLLQYYR
jgi:hypothetical protein